MSIYDSTYNVIISDIEASCASCQQPTRYYVIEMDRYLCHGCILTFDSMIKDDDLPN